MNNDRLIVILDSDGHVTATPLTAESVDQCLRWLLEAGESLADGESRRLKTKRAITAFLKSLSLEQKIDLLPCGRSFGNNINVVRSQSLPAKRLNPFC